MPIYAAQLKIAATPRLKISQPHEVRGFDRVKPMFASIGGGALLVASLDSDTLTDLR